MSTSTTGLNHDWAPPSVKTASRAVPPMPPSPVVVGPAPTAQVMLAPSAAPAARAVPPMPPMPAIPATPAPATPAPAPPVTPTPAAPQPGPASPEPTVGEAPGATPAEIERILVEELSELVPVDEVTVDGNFFDDLGADSMVMARFCARVRKQPSLPSIAIKDIYANPTIASLATSMADAPPEPVQRDTDTGSATRDIVVPARTAAYVACGIGQFLFFAVFALIGSLIAIRGFVWLTGGANALAIYLRAVVLLTGSFVGFSLLPIVAKWLLIGRWKPVPFRVWGLRYYRFWVVKSLIRSSPFALLNGRSNTSSSSPLLTFYLRALGAKVGRGVTFLSRGIPVCTDLLTIGDNTVVRKDSLINCYQARAGMIEPGRVTLGKHVFVGEATVLDINTAVEDGAQLGHSSSLQPGETVPTNQRFQGSPAKPTELDYRPADVVGGSTRRRALYGAYQVVSGLFLFGPIAITIAVLVIEAIPELNAFVDPAASGFAWFSFVQFAALFSAALLLLSIAVGLLVAGTVPRLLKRFVQPGVTYPLFGVRYFVHRLIAGMTNIQFFTILFGDSSFVVRYLQWIGYDLGDVEQTGSNFGTQFKHESPFLTKVGAGTVIADGLSAINADFSSTSFRLAPVAIGGNNFLGNNIAYPSQGKTGNDCLLGTKVAVPLTGGTREGVGLLGSPNFEIPRSVDRDRALEIAHNEELLRPLLLRVKDRHNLVTMAMFLFVRWLLGILLLLQTAVVFAAYRSVGPVAVAVFGVVSPTLVVGYWILVDRAFHRLQALEPDGCSIYHRNFWRHERYWKVPAFRYLQAYNGTPFKTMIWRALGVKVGAKVFDDGAFITEKAFASIGDHCTLNIGSTIQCHSQEDGGFKSDRTSIGDGCTLGVGAFVHYGVTIGPEAVLKADSFLMKGQEIPAQTVWAGNPAQEIPR